METCIYSTRFNCLLTKMKNKFPLTHFLLLVGLILIFSLILFPQRRMQLQSRTELEEPTIDVWIFYTPQDLADVLPAFDLQSRWVYAVSELTLDLAFPLLYTALLRLLVNYLTARLGFQPTWPIRFTYALLAADLLENMGIAALLWIHLSAPPLLIWATTAASALKWMVGFVCVGMIACGSVWLGLRRLLKKQGGASS